MFGENVAEHIRINAYRAIVESVLLYNCGTWALPVTVADRLDRAQRKMIRRVIGVKWYDKVSNTDLYTRCGLCPASEVVIHSRWRLFGHTLRLSEKTPAREAMSYYFQRDQIGRQGNFVTIATTLSREYKLITSQSINTQDEYNSVVLAAQDRDAWKQLARKITNKCKELQKAKALSRSEKST